MPVLVIFSLYVFYVVCLHIPIFFRGIFPLFGTFLFDLPGILAIDFSIAFLLLLAWGTSNRKIWAWWGGLIYFILLTVSTLLTFLRSSYLDILQRMQFPPTEMDALDGVPLLATLGVVALSKKHFVREKRD
ncbi:MAG: hypothetical protein A2Y73_04890 [Chloroflexi bacterium RBG_13_56_8]|nr:MAG: hypothetical protein A2Y73_04890 [Chloroflexi bacterium RBG_13_56_8]